MTDNVSKYRAEGGIHRVPLWRIAGFALNNTATNFYLYLMNYVAYYLTGFVGVATITASSFSTCMRLWDGVTDPIIGYVVDKTDGKFGKNRPFMILGNVLLCITSFILFHITHLLPENTFIRFGFFIVVSAIYYIGYTFQCCVTKSAQSCITNDPKQRPMFTVFDASYKTIQQTFFAFVAATASGRHGDTFYNPAVFHEMWVVAAVGSAILTIIAVISIAPKDRTEFFGTGKATRVGLKDYWDTIKNNRAIQMLVLSASTDKLANSARTGAVTAVMFGVVAGNFKWNAAATGFTSIPTVILTILVISTLATKLGQRKGMMIGSLGGITFSLLLCALWIFGDPTTLGNPDGTLAFSFFTIAYIVLTILDSSFNNLANNIVIPMTADCTDYEVYRSGRYVPGMIGTLFSFVDKLVSSLAPMIAGLMFALVGFADKLPDQSAPYSTGLHFTGIFLMYGLLILGQTVNLIAMKFYPLTKEKMDEIRSEIDRIKAASK